MALATTKLFRVGDFLFGGAGSHRVSNILRFTLQHINHENSMDNEEFISRYLVESLRTALRDGGALHTESGIDHIGAKDDTSGFLVGYRGRLFWLAYDLSVSQYETPYFAIGSGDAYALGSLHASAALASSVQLTPEQRVTMALEAACAFDIGCGGSIVIESLPAMPQKQWMEDAPVVRYPFETVHNGIGAAS